MPKNPRLNFYVRLDAQGRPIEGSGVYRLKQPTVGRWQKIESQGCCSGLELRTTPADVTDDTFTITIACDTVDLIVATVTGDVATADVSELVALLRQKAEYLGSWSVDGDEVVLQLNSDIAFNCADSADLELTIAVA
jgi:hypothetical protein